MSSIGCFNTGNMEKNVTTESGLQLIARLYKRPSLLHLDDILFPGGPEPGDIVQISGQSSVGKSLLLLKFLTKCLLPQSYEGIDIGGLEAGVILINTDHNISILKLGSLMEQFLYNVSITLFNREKALLLRSPDQIEKIIIESLKRLIVLKTYSSLQLEMNFYSLKKILSGNSNISVVMIDSLTSYYWCDVTNYKNIKKMDLYLKVLIEKLKKCLEEFKMVIIFVTQEYFQCKQSDYSSNLINHKIELRKNEDSENFTAFIDSQKILFEYCLSEKGFISGCGYQSKFEELSTAIKSNFPDVEIVPAEGRIGSFEVTINDVLVYSKLQTLAFPDFQCVIEVVKEVHNGMPPRQVDKQQPRDFCNIA